MEIQHHWTYASIKDELDVYGDSFPNLDVALADALDDRAREAASAYVLAAPLAIVSMAATKG
jgi:hypothetical protein